MWQIMWMLSLLPEWFWHVFTVAGVLAVISSWILKRIPFVNTYNLPLKVVGTVIVLGGLFMEGGIATEAKWQAKVQQMQDKIAEAEAASAAVNRNIEVKVVTKTKVVKERGAEIIKYIDKNTEIVKFVENCPLPPEIIEIHNAAADMNKATEGAKK